MSSPERKRRKKKEPSPSPSPQWTPNPSLPYDLQLSCIARVPRLYYPTLSLVSKSFRSLIASPELYKARSLFGHTESCLYACIQSCGGHGPNWYTLCRKPNKTLTNGTKSSGYVLARVPIPDSPPALFSGLVTVGSNIYNIGGSGIKSKAKGSYSRVSILDCRSHTWSEAPSLRVEPRILSASVIDRKIYVAGRCKDGDSSSLKSSFEVFDTKAQVWDPVPSSERGVVVCYLTASIEGKFHVKTNNEVVAYDPKEGRWDVVGRRMGWYLDSEAFCEIDNVLYSASKGVFGWYDAQVRMWRNLTGLVGLPKPTRESRVKLADYGGKMVVLWEVEGPRFVHPWGGFKKKIWCAEIALERRNSCEICGKVEWLDHVLIVPSMSRVVKVLAATV